MDDHPTNWMQWVSWFEFAYNVRLYCILNATGFEVVYRQLILRLISYCPGLLKLEAVDCELRTCDQVLQGLRH